MPQSEVSILMVDDSELEAELVLDTLREISDYRVDLTHLDDPEYTYLHLYMGYFDVAFIDYRFGGSMTGIDLVQELRQLNYTGPIYMITARGNDVVKRQSMEAGVDGYLEKDNLSSNSLQEILNQSISREKGSVS